MIFDFFPIFPPGKQCDRRTSVVRCFLAAIIYRDHPLLLGIESGPGTCSEPRSAGRALRSGKIKMRSKVRFDGERVLDGLRLRFPGIFLEWLPICVMF